MDEMVAITGQLVDIRNVATHKVARLVVDVPAEQAAGIISVFGWPTMVNPVPVAIARLVNPEGSQPAPSGQDREVAEGQSAPPASLQPSDRPERRRWDELKPSQQAGIRCADPVFRKFLEDRSPGHKFNNEEEAAECVRYLCEITSRSEITTGERSGVLWGNLELRFQNWRLADKMGALT